MKSNSRPTTVPVPYIPEYISVQAVLTRHPARIVVGTEPEFKVAHMIGRQLDLDCDWLVAAVAASEHAAAILPSRLVRSRLQKL